MRARLLQLLNVRKDEAWLVTNLFWLQFFQGAGVAIFNTVAFAMFLEHFDVNELPKVYLFSAILLWIAGLLYTKVEHSLPVKKLVPAVILFVAGSILFFRVELSLINSPIFLFVLFSWYYVIYLLTNLEFWGVAALLFDIRQSKRLFGMIGAGDIPAKLIGYSAVPILVKFLQNENILLLSFGSILLSLIFYQRLKNGGKLDIHIKHEHQHTAHHSTEKAKDIIKSFFGNRMIAFVALLSFIVVTCATIISFSFYSEIKHEAKTDEQLASFIAMFYAGGRILAIFIRFVLTGRLANTLGTKGALLISPSILFVLLVTIMVLPFVTHGEHTVLYIFGIMAIVTEVLKTSLQDPIFLSLMQPLSQHLRLKGHTIVKGVMDPFALAFSGFMLFGLLKLSGKIDLFLESYLLFTLLIGWVIVVFAVDREYIKTLLTALDKRYSVGQEINLSDEQTQLVLAEKISTGERGEAIYILNLVERQYAPEKEPLVLNALRHPAPEVRMEAIRLAERKRIYSALPYLDEIISTRNDALMPEAVKAKCMLQPDELENFDEILAMNDDRLTRSAITGFMSSGGINAVVTAGTRLLQLIASENKFDRKIAAQVIGELKVSSFYKPLLELMKDTDDDVALAALEAAGKVKNEKLNNAIIQFFLQRKFEKTALEAMAHSGETILPDLIKLLKSSSLTRQQKNKLIRLHGRIGGPLAQKYLYSLLHELPDARQEIFHALHLCEFKGHHHKNELTEFIRSYTNTAIRIVFMIQELENVKTTKILRDALHIELNNIRDNILLLFSFIYDHEKMLRARSAFTAQSKEAIANALEVIEIEVPREFSLKFNRLFEPGAIDEKCKLLAAEFKEKLTYESIITEILETSKYPFHRWTKATALHSVIFYKGDKKSTWLKNATVSPDTLIYETATRIKAEIA